jgi:hypothetical protein
MIVGWRLDDGEWLSVVEALRGRALRVTLATRAAFSVRGHIDVDGTVVVCGWKQSSVALTLHGFFSACELGLTLIFAQWRVSHNLDGRFIAPQKEIPVHSWTVLEKALAGEFQNWLCALELQSTDFERRRQRRCCEVPVSTHCVPYLHQAVSPVYWWQCLLCLVLFVDGRVKNLLFRQVDCISSTSSYSWWLQSM